MGRLQKTFTTVLATLLPMVVLFLPYVTQAADGLTGVAQELLFVLVLAITGLFLWLGGVILDAGIERFLVGFSDTYLYSGVGIAIDSSWVVVRDAMNLLFIFGLVYIGLRMILDSDNGNVRRWLINLILAALLINFSLFITKFVVDFTNLISYEIAKEGLGAKEISPGKLELNLSEDIRTRMGIQSLLGGLPAGAGWGYIFGTGIFFMITAFVFAAGGILLMIRFVILSIFLALSPFMFLSWILPMVRDTMNKYWSDFLGRAFFAPVYLFFIYLSLQIIGEMQKSIQGGVAGNQANYLAMLNAAGGKSSVSAHDAAMGTLPFFVMICIFMIASLVIAQKIGADGAGKAISMGKSLSNKAQGYAKRGAGAATFGSVAIVGQKTAGYGARKLADSGRLNKWAANSKWGERTMRAARGVADSSFDGRAVVGQELGMGSGMKGGYDTRVKNRQKRDEEFMKSLKVDISPEESEARQAAERARITGEAETQKQGGKNELETIEAMAENDGKTTVALTGEINSLGKEIEELSKALSSKVEAGTITTKEQAEEEIRIARLADVQNKKVLARQELQAQKALQGKITSTGLRLTETSDPVEAAKIREEKQQAEAELARMKNYDDRKDRARTEIKSAAERMEKDNLDKEVNREVAREENRIKYEHQEAYLKRRQREAADGPLRSGQGWYAKESVSHLKKTFGRNATEMANKDSKNQANKDLAKQLKALQDAESGGGKANKKEEGGNAQ